MIRNIQMIRNSREYRLQPVIFERCKEQLLIRIQIHLLSKHTEVHGFQILGTFRYDDNVCTVFALERLTQASRRQELVIDDGSVIVHKQDVYTRLDIAMLEGIIEHDDIRLFRAVVMNQLINASCPFGIYCHRHFRVFLLDLVRLVANHLHWCLSRSQYIAIAFAFVASAQHGYAELVLQETDEIFYMRGLSCATNGDITHGDNRYGVRLALQDIHLKEHVPELHAQTVQPAQRQQLLVKLNEIPLHS